MPSGIFVVMWWQDFWNASLPLFLQDKTRGMPRKQANLFSLTEMANSEFGQAFEGLKSSEFYQAPPAAPAAPGASAARSAGSGYSILVNHRQRGNPVLKAICTVPWEFSDIQPDYVLGAKTCALFLSLRYHQLNPGYVAERVQALGSAFELRVLLVQVGGMHTGRDEAGECYYA